VGESTGRARDPIAVPRGVGESRYFLTREVPLLLREIAEREPPRELVDLGCGEGSLIWSLAQVRLLPGRVFAVDLSRERLETAAAISPKVTAIAADVTAVDELGDACVDAVMCSQVIEHLPDDRRLAPEIARILRPGGWFYVSSVIRDRHAWWIYRRDGRAIVDPSHEREYRSPQELAEALAHEALAIERVRVVPLRFPVCDLFLRLLVAARLLSRSSLPTFYARAPRWLELTRRLRIRVPGYSWIEVSGHRYERA